MTGAPGSVTPFKSIPGPPADAAVLSRAWYQITGTR